jgi:hypothetical protein
MVDPASPQPAAAPGVATVAPPELLVVGRLVGAQGLGGELRVLPLSDFPERFTRMLKALRPLPDGLYFGAIRRAVRV